MNNLESCIVEIKKAIARIEEQTKTIFKNLSEYRDWSEKLHAEHFEAANNLRKETSELCRSFDVRISKHDVDIHSIQKGLGKLEELLQQIVQNSAKTKGIALGLGMAGGAIVSILTLLAEIIK
ncbi:MAG: hypothetical protein JRH06_17675 [Deltaproteobacteria bacterium]|nr:hypothetical protein [Deltaproteobacteria bacterium]MBW2139361.1 hypothetical protein [Deltaproteobacteria bacterium]